MPANMMTDRDIKDIKNNSNLIVIRTINNVEDEKKGYYKFNDYIYSVNEVISSIENVRAGKDPKTYLNLIVNMEKESKGVIQNVNNNKEFTTDVNEASVFTVNEGEAIVAELKSKDTDTEVISFFSLFPKYDFRSDLTQASDEVQSSDTNLYNIIFPNNEVDEITFNSKIAPIKNLVVQECNTLGYDMRSNPFLAFVRNYIKNFPKDKIITEDQYGVIQDLYVKRVINDTNLQSPNTFINTKSLYDVKNIDDFEFIIKAYYYLSKKFELGQITNKDIINTYLVNNPQKSKARNMLRDDIIFGKFGDMNDFSKREDVVDLPINDSDTIKNSINSLEGEYGSANWSGKNPLKDNTTKSGNSSDSEIKFTDKNIKPLTDNFLSVLLNVYDNNEQDVLSYLTNHLRDLKVQTNKENKDNNK